MKKISKIIIGLMLMCFVCFQPAVQTNCKASKADEMNDYYIVYDSAVDGEILFMRGSKVEVGDEYISYNNKLYKIDEVSEETKLGKASFVEDITLGQM